MAARDDREERWSAEVWRAAALVVLLAGLQLGACGLQWQRGFRPGVTSASRVAYSWDMFATPIDRCALRWSPALPVAGGVGQLSDVGRPLEWTPVFDSVAQYQAAGRAGCALADAPTRVVLQCFLADGGVLHDQFDCP